MRRAQAAMEYLITYGWAVLIMLVVVGVLFYLGIFNPKSIAACTFQTPGFTCYAYKLASNTSNSESGLILDLGQATGHDIKVTGVNCTATGTWSVTEFNASQRNVTISSGSHSMLNGTSANPGVMKCYKADGTVVSASDASVYYSGKIYIHYYDTETNLDHKVIGDISGKVE